VPVYYSPWAQNLCNPNDVSVVASPPSGTCFSLGDHTVDVWAYGSGQSNHCSFTVTVLRDPNCLSNQSPCLQLQCPTYLAAYAGCGSNCAPVFFSVSASNSCNPTNLTTTIDLPPGTCFPLGTTWVHFTAYAPLSGESNQCSFPVTVLPDPACTNGCSTNLLVNGSFEEPGVPYGYAVLSSTLSMNDCNHNGIPDAVDIATGRSADLNFNGLPDECESFVGGPIFISGWKTLLNGVEYYNPVVAPAPVNTGAAADGAYLLDLAPITGLGGGIEQTFATVSGRPYHVTFMLGTSKERGRLGTASLTVAVAGNVESFNTATDNPFITWKLIAFNFIANSNMTTLAFSSLDDPALSFVNLDDVRVSYCCDDSGLIITPTVTVEWNCGILQSAPTVTGPYTDVPGATSPYTVPTSDPNRFFRTRPR
jgi:Protein of unknown function (DUF642)/HYR domain